MKEKFQHVATKIQQQVGIALLIAAIKRFTSLGHKTHAAALTYTTLFALVPLLTVTYSVLSMIPSLQENRSEIEALMLGNLVPSSGDALMGYLYQFSQQAQQLTAVGIVLLVITAFMMLRSIENTFNQVWQLKQGRKGLSSFLLYWAILSLGPLMLSAGIAVSSYIASFSLWKEDWVPTYGTLALGLFIPYLTSFLAFTLIYWAVPNCNVPLKHAAIGGAVVALFFEIGQEVFAEATTFFPSYQLIYGAFAAVPLFLMWLYLSWLVILLGAEIVYLQGAGRLSEQDELSRVDDALGLRILSILHAQQINGEGLALNELKEVMKNGKSGKAGLGSLRKTLSYLEELKLVIKKTEGQYFLVRNLTNYSLYEYLQHIAPKKWFELIKSEFPSGGLDLFELEQVLVRQQSDLKKHTSVAMQSYLLPANNNKAVGVTKFEND